MWKQGYRVPNSWCYLKMFGSRVLDSGSFKSHWGPGFQVLGSTLPVCNIISNQPNNSTLADKIESNQHNVALARSSVFKPIKRRGGGEIILARKTFINSKMVNATSTRLCTFYYISIWKILRKFHTSTIYHSWNIYNLWNRHLKFPLIFIQNLIKLNYS